MEILSHGVVSRKTHGKLNYNGWGSVITLRDKTMLCAWSGNRHKHVCPFGKVLAARSEDGGRTWGPPYVAFESPLDDRDAGLCQTADGSVFLTTFNNSRETQRAHLDPKGARYTEAERAHLDPKGARYTEAERAVYEAYRSFYEGYLAMTTDEEERRWLGSVIARSDDGGKTFSDSAVLPITSPHGPLALPNGNLLYIGRAFSDPAAASFPYLEEGIYALEIDRNLKAGKPRLVVPADPREDVELCEPHACLLPSGKIVLGIRVQSRRKWLFTVYECSSDDGGKTFSAPRETDFEGSPPHYFAHSSGALVLTYGRRIEPYAEIARVSYDEGETWSEEFVLRSAPDSDLGYPCTAENERGELVTVYYQRADASDPACSILSTTWKL